MSDFGTMKTRIATEIARSNLSSQISAAVLSAIADHEREQFYFNEARDITFDTVAAQEYYDADDASGIPSIGKIIRATCTVLASDVFTLDLTTWGQIEDSYSGNTDIGIPAAIAAFDQKLRIYPIPDAAYGIRIAYLKKFDALSDDTDSNAWMTDGEALIRARAKYLLFRDVIYSPERMTLAERAVAEQLDLLRTETRNRVASGRVKPCGF